MKFEDYIIDMNIRAVYYTLDGSFDEAMHTDKFDYKDGKLYYKGSLVHREDGPALEWDDGDREWYLNGDQYTEKKYTELIKIKNMNKILNET
jgi:hypothetical protein